MTMTVTKSDQVKPELAKNPRCDIGRLLYLLCCSCIAAVGIWMICGIAPLKTKISTLYDVCSCELRLLSYDNIQIGVSCPERATTKQYTLTVTPEKRGGKGGKLVYYIGNFGWYPEPVAIVPQTGELYRPKYSECFGLKEDVETQSVASYYDVPQVTFDKYSDQATAIYISGILISVIAGLGILTLFWCEAYQCECGKESKDSESKSKEQSETKSKK